MEIKLDQPKLEFLTISVIKEEEESDLDSRRELSLPLTKNEPLKS